MNRIPRRVSVGLVLAAGLVAGGLSGCSTSAKRPSGTGSSDSGLPGAPGLMTDPGIPGVPTGSATTPVVTDPSAPIVPVEPFDAFTPEVYATKVKDVLTGLPLTDAEYLRVKADPLALKVLINEWMMLQSFKSGIDSATGMLSATGDIPPEQTLASTGKTFNALLGVPNDVIESSMTSGKVIAAAVA